MLPCLLYVNWSSPDYPYKIKILTTAKFVACFLVDIIQKQPDNIVVGLSCNLGAMSLTLYPSGQGTLQLRRIPKNQRENKNNKNRLIMVGSDHNQPVRSNRTVLLRI